MDQLEALRMAGEKPRGAAIPTFYVEPVENTFKSNQEGRPVYDEMEFVKFVIPGDRNAQPVQRVDEEIKRRYPKEYQAFKDGIELPLEGTPLAEWPPIKRSQVQELAHFNIRTVEQLAAVNDIQLQHLGMGVRELRQQAATYLEVAREGTGPIAKILSRLDSVEAQLAAKDNLLAEAEKRIKELEANNARPAA